MAMTLVRSEVYPEAAYYQGPGQRGGFDIAGPTGALGTDWLIKEVVEVNFRGAGETLLEIHIFEDRVGTFSSNWHVEILGHASPGPMVIFAIIAGVLTLLITIKLLGWKVEDIVYPIVKPIQETIEKVAAQVAQPLQAVGAGLQKAAEKVGGGIGTAMAIGIPILAVGAGVAAYAYAKRR